MLMPTHTAIVYIIVLFCPNLAGSQIHLLAASRCPSSLRSLGTSRSLATY
jgi:hypothetical protein